MPRTVRSGGTRDAISIRLAGKVLLEKNAIKLRPFEKRRTEGLPVRHVRMDPRREYTEDTAFLESLVMADNPCPGCGSKMCNSIRCEGWYSDGHRQDPSRHGSGVSRPSHARERDMKLAGISSSIPRIEKKEFSSHVALPSTKPSVPPTEPGRNVWGIALLPALAKVGPDVAHISPHLSAHYSLNGRGGRSRGRGRGRGRGVQQLRVRQHDWDEARAPMERSGGSPNPGALRGRGRGRGRSGRVGSMGRQRGRGRHRGSGRPLIWS